MLIPRHTVKPRFYVATSILRAFSSWNTLEDAQACWERFKNSNDPYTMDACQQIKGIVRVDSSGRNWVVK